MDRERTPSGSASAYTEQLGRVRELLPALDTTTAKCLGRGWEVVAFRAGDWVVRVPRFPSNRQRIERQTGLYRVLSETGLRVPQDARAVYGEDGDLVAGIYRYIPGLPARATRRPASLARGLGGFLTALHAFPTGPVRELCDVADDLWSGRYEPCWEYCRAQLPAAQREWLEGVIERFLRAGGTAGGSTALIHADLAEEHVLVDRDGRLRGVIDFNGPRIADPALDFGTLAERFGWPFAEAALSAYGCTIDRGFVRRARFYADVRPLVAIQSGLRHERAEWLREGFRRLAARIDLAEDPG